MSVLVPSVVAAPAARRRVRVVVGDADGLARRMLRTTLERSDSIVVIGCAGELREVTQLCRHYRPEVLILDTGVVEGRAAEAVRALLARSPHTRVMTMAAERDDGEVIAALRAGAAGHVDKDLDPWELGRLVDRVASGESIVPPDLVTALVQALRDVPEGGWRPLHSRLTTREWEIVELLAEGSSTELMAERLVLSPATVYSHVKSLLRKLGVTCRRDAIAAAERLRHEEVNGGAPLAA